MKKKTLSVFLLCCISFLLSAKNPTLSVAEIFSRSNEQLAADTAGRLSYIYKVKPYLTNRVFRFDFRLQYNKTSISEDSLGSFLFEDSPGYGAAFFGNQVFFYDTSEKKITIMSLDTSDNKTVSDLVSNSCHFLYQPFIMQNRIRISPPTEFLHSEISNDTLFGMACVKATFWNTQKEEVTKDDRKVYYFRSSDFSLLKYESTGYDSEADDISTKTIDSVGVKAISEITHLAFPEFLDNLMRTGMKLEYYNPYAVDSSVAAIDTMTYIPDWELTDSNGRKFRLSELKSRYVLCDFSYLSCYFCMKAMPMLNRYFVEYKSADLSVFWIDSRDYDNKDYLKSVFLKKGATYPVYYDVGRTLINSYGVTSFPTLLLVEMPSGKILKKMVGYSLALEQELDAAIKNLFR